MEIIEKREANVNMCRHCYKNKIEFLGLWATFFEEVDFKEVPRLRIFDHLSANKYWLITQPYYVFDETGEINRETEEAITNVLQYGVNCAIIKDGYHYEDTSTIIFYPVDADKFKDTVNSSLDKHSRYDSYIRTLIGFTTFSKSYTRRLIRNYEIPEKSEIIKSALDFLTWEAKS